MASVHVPFETVRSTVGRAERRVYVVRVRWCLFQDGCSSTRPSPVQLWPPDPPAGAGLPRLWLTAPYSSDRKHDPAHRSIPRPFLAPRLPPGIPRERRNEVSTSVLCIRTYTPTLAPHQPTPASLPFLYTPIAGKPPYSLFTQPTLRYASSASPRVTSPRAVVLFYRLSDVLHSQFSEFCLQAAVRRKTIVVWPLKDA